MVRQRVAPRNQERPQADTLSVPPRGCAAYPRTRKPRAAKALHRLVHKPPPQKKQTNNKTKSPAGDPSSPRPAPPPTRQPVDSNSCGQGPRISSTTPYPVDQVVLGNAIVICPSHLSRQSRRLAKTPTAKLEPTTTRLRALHSTDWPRRAWHLRQS